MNADEEKQPVPSDNKPDSMDPSDSSTKSGSSNNRPGPSGIRKRGYSRPTLTDQSIPPKKQATNQTNQNKEDAPLREVS